MIRWARLFSLEHDVILVTVNRRSGNFCFLKFCIALDTVEYSGNMGRKDVRLPFNIFFLVVKKKTTQLDLMDKFQVKFK